MKRRGDLNQSLEKEFFFGRRDKPDFFPGFVSLEKFPRVELRDSARELFFFVQVRVERGRFSFHENEIIAN